MDARTIRRTAFAIVGVLGVALALIALFLLSWTPQNSDDYESLHIGILLVNVAGVVVMANEKVDITPLVVERLNAAAAAGGS